MKTATRRLFHKLGLISTCCLLLPATNTLAQQSSDTTTSSTIDDGGKREVARLRVDLYYGTNENLPKLSFQAQNVGAESLHKLQAQKSLKFQHYLLLGSDEQPIWQVYQNWATPLKPSEEILISFEATGRTPDGALRLDLEYWQSRKMIAKFDPVLREGKTFYILGPEWRNGRLIIGLVATKFSM